MVLEAHKIIFFRNKTKVSTKIEIKNITSFFDDAKENQSLREKKSNKKCLSNFRSNISFKSYFCNLLKKTCLGNLQIVFKILNFLLLQNSELKLLKSIIETKFGFV
jgi:hypothetical protein